MEKRLLLIVLTFLPFLSFAQESKKIDSTAIFILDKMNDIIGDLESVSFNVATSSDKINVEQNIETHFSTSSVSMVGPDKLMSRTKGDRGNYGIWYDGAFISYYSFDENNYVTLEAPDNIITMIDSMHVKFDFKFPAADFFYPSFTDDIIDAFDTVKYIGKKIVEGEECFHIMATNNEMHVQIWISNDTGMLPKKLLIMDKNENNLQIESTFTDWSLNPNIPESVFDFLPPPNARLISILAKS
ncbi:DUF2092 domain-containing protein [Yeosuana sp. MJ-SS3]|uniref:DUF2092 domain-containing protein n=1 Tax=Gilvirhabdus luticola TaxID=3079858 RepID=A0ABU3U5R1_9FLAO|nr:DUF2092 domain-containing protein [Yeosuana sp. MJ-SS3]MDU8885744.1 DUF2092 domain-containing protein [Yeosuana sp. MJ-SS3]